MVMPCGMLHLHCQQMIWNYLGKDHLDVSVKVLLETVNSGGKDINPPPTVDSRVSHA